jgi:hypothetical protein
MDKYEIKEVLNDKYEINPKSPFLNCLVHLLFAIEDNLTCGSIVGGWQFASVLWKKKYQETMPQFLCSFPGDERYILKHLL